MTPQKKKVGHNRGSLEQSYYWGSGWLMDYFLEKSVGAMFQWGFNKASYILGKNTF